VPTSLHDSAGPPLITLRDCNVVLGGRRVLRELDFELRRGDRCLLVGANGAGKTLLLKLLRGDIWPTPNGRVLRRYQFDGEIGEEPLGFKERMAYVGSERQDRYERHDFDLTLEEVVTTGLYDEDIPLTRSTRAERARVRRVLERFDIDRLRARRMLSLSYGQRRLALIARAYVSRPVVLLLDEPFNGLDQICADRLRHSLAQRGGPAAWVLATHRPAEAPGNINRRLSLHEGRLTEPGRTRRTMHARAQAHSGPGLRSRRLQRRYRADGRATLVELRNAVVYRNYRRVLGRLDWRVEQGEHWQVTGPTGAGKSTLLSLLYGDLQPALGGYVRRDGCPQGTPIEVWKRRVGYVSPELQTTYRRAASVEEVLISGLHSSIGLSEAPTRSERRRVHRWLDNPEIDTLKDRPPAQLSYGQFRLLLLARALVRPRDLLLLDEPLTSLDAGKRAAALAWIAEAIAAGATVVMSTHHPEEALPWRMRELKLSHGRARPGLSYFSPSM